MFKQVNRSILYGAIVTLALVFSSLQAQDYVVITKVRYLKSFTKYVEWPNDYKSGDFVIGVLDNATMANALSLKLKDRTVGNQSFKIINYTSASDIGRCHILYIPPEKSSDLKTALSRVKSYSTLVVTDKPGLVEEGSGINLVRNGAMFQFEINQKIMKKSELTVSSLLIPMAAKVIE